MPKVQSITALLPQGKFFDQLFAAAIQPACQAGGAACTRPDPEFSSANRLGKACAEIENADLVVADLSGKNPNVLYLAGYAHGAGKRVVFLAQHGEDLPFDPARHEILVYHASADLLKNELAGFFESGTRPKQGPAPGAQEESAREKFEAIFGEIMREHRAVHSGAIEMENKTTFVLLNQDLDLPVVQHLARRARELGLRIKLL